MKKKKTWYSWNWCCWCDFNAQFSLKKGGNIYFKNKNKIRKGKGNLKRRGKKKKKRTHAHNRTRPLAFLTTTLWFALRNFNYFLYTSPVSKEREKKDILFFKTLHLPHFVTVYNCDSCQPVVGHCFFAFSSFFFVVSKRNTACSIIS